MLGAGACSSRAFDHPHQGWFRLQDIAQRSTSVGEAAGRSDEGREEEVVESEHSSRGGDSRYSLSVVWLVDAVHPIGSMMPSPRFSLFASLCCCCCCCCCCCLGCCFVVGFSFLLLLGCPVLFAPRLFVCVAVVRHLRLHPSFRRSAHGATFPSQRFQLLSPSAAQVQQASRREN